MQSLLRWLTVLAVIGAVTAGIVVLALGLFQGPTTPPPPSPPPAAPVPEAKAPPAKPAVAQVALAAERQAEAPIANPAPTQPVGAPKASLFGDRVVVHDSHLTIVTKQEVPSQRDGQLLYLATEPKPGEEKDIPKDRLVEVLETYAYATVDGKDQLPPGTPTAAWNGKVYRRLLDTDTIEPSDLTTRVVILRQLRRLKLLHEGDEVKTGDLLGMVDPAIAVDDYLSKATAVEAARADRDASEKTREEAKQRYLTMDRLYNLSQKNVSLEDLRGAKLTWDKYYYEEIGKREAIKKAFAELNAALTILKLHEIRAKINGVVKSVNKQRGEAVKGGDQVVLLNDHDRLRLEGQIEVQYISRLPVGTVMAVEPSQPRPPLRVLRGHLQPVRAVAVTRDYHIVSASDDSTHVWDRDGDTDRPVPTRSPTRSLACSPTENLLATGGADGVGRLWNLAGQEPTPVAELTGGHRSQINAIAFSPDGEWIATGGEDQALCLWDKSGKRLAEPDRNGHVGGITSVKFLTRNQVVTAGKDGRLVLWTLAGDGKPSVKNGGIWENRTGKVTNLGVYQDKEHPERAKLLFDQGPVLRLLSPATGRTLGELENFGGNLDFTDMAVFSPDGQLVLTNASAENRVQLWKLPSGDRRAFELRQLVWSGAPITCGAFSPAAAGSDDAFIVTGTEDEQVVIWQMPSKAEVEQQLIAKVTFVDKALDTASRQVRVWADIDNTARLLYPGLPATMVELPGQK
jgi:WD40 repeat protein